MNAQNIFIYKLQINFYKPYNYINIYIYNIYIFYFIINIKFTISTFILLI